LQVTCDRWFSPGTPISSTNKTDCHNITEILLTVALNTFNISVIFVVFENSTWLLSGQLYLKYCIHRNHACWSTCSYIGWMFHTWPSTKVLVDYIQILITGPFENKFWNVFSKYKNNRSNNKSDRRQVNIWDTWKILKYLNLNDSFHLKDFEISKYKRESKVRMPIKFGCLFFVNCGLFSFLNIKKIKI
jgi:hypothetical protein